MKKFALSALALFAVASMALASGLNQFKAGDISFSVLDKDGATPLASASIKLISSGSGDVVAEATADEMGQAVVAVDEGRYLLNISDINLAVFDVSSAEGISACRVIMPDAALLVGGQDDEDDDAKGAGAFAGGGAGGSAAAGSAWVWPVVGGVAAVAVLVGAGFVIDHNTGGHHHGNGEAVAPAEPETPVYRKKSSSKKSPSAT